ncbi:hypothetical protein D3C81_1820710 [compost metagenome]
MGERYEGGAAYGIENDTGTQSAGQRHCRFDNILFLADDDMCGACIQQRLFLCPRAGNGDGGGAHHSGNLKGCQSDAAGSSGNQNKITFLQFCLLD